MVFINSVFLYDVHLFKLVGRWLNCWWSITLFSLLLWKYCTFPFYIFFFYWSIIWLHAGKNQGQCLHLLLISSRRDSYLYLSRIFFFSSSWLHIDIVDLSILFKTCSLDRFWFSVDILLCDCIWSLEQNIGRVSKTI